jgi:hypothetical protein
MYIIKEYLKKVDTLLLISGVSMWAPIKKMYTPHIHSPYPYIIFTKGFGHIERVRHAWRHAWVRVEHHICIFKRIFKESTP